jgi:hypothetical protein
LVEEEEMMEMSDNISEEIRTPKRVRQRACNINERIYIFQETIDMQGVKQCNGGDCLREFLKQSSKL